MRFVDWFKASGLTEEQAAEMCGVSRSYIARLKRGSRPSDDIKMKIEKGTEGLVRYEDWKPEVHEGDSDADDPPVQSQLDLTSGAAA